MQKIAMVCIYGIYVLLDLLGGVLRPWWPVEVDRLTGIMSTSNVQSRSALIGLVLLATVSTAWSQDDSSFITGLIYEITVPSGCNFWVLSDKRSVAVGLESSMCLRRPGKDMSDIESLFDSHPTLYPKFSKTTKVELVANHAEAAMVKVTQSDGSHALGWIAWSRVEIPPETLKRLQADRDAAKQRRIEAQRIIEAMPRVIGKESPVLIATSMDCSKDLQKIATFTRLNGFGVEARKKTSEFISMGCGYALDVGTILVGAERNGEFVKFIGTTSEDYKFGIALPENVLWPGHPVALAPSKPAPAKASAIKQ